MLNKNTLFGRSAETPQREAVRAVATPAAAPRAPAPESALGDAPRTSAATAAAAGGSKLIVGPDIKLKGVEITDCDTLVVEGRVEATMDSRVIQIAEHGAYAGTVGIDIAEIRGRFEGELTARKRLVVYATGSVAGTIRYGKVVVEEGGTLSGDVRTLAAAAPQPLSASANDPQPAGGPATTAEMRGVAEAIAERSRNHLLRRP